MRGMLATHVAFSHCYAPLIYYVTERSLIKKCPPPGKSLKKAMPDFVLSPVLVFRWLEFRSVPPDKTYPLLVSFEVFGIIWKIMKRYTLRKLCVHTTDTTIGPSDARSAIMFRHFGLLVMKY